MQIAGVRPEAVVTYSEFGSSRAICANPYHPKWEGILMQIAGVESRRNRSLLLVVTVTRYAQNSPHYL